MKIFKKKKEQKDFPPEKKVESKISDQFSQTLELQKKYDEAMGGWKRARADYANMQKRVAAEKSIWAEAANERLIFDLLPIVDNFEYAFQGLSEKEETNNWVKGFSCIRQQLKDLLARYNVTSLKTVGEKFDPLFHEAIGEVVVKGKEKGMIVEEKRKGYRRGDKILRAARVVIAK